MSPVTLFEDARWPRLLPLVYLRGVGELLFGTQTLRERTEAAGSAAPARSGSGRTSRN